MSKQYGKAKRLMTAVALLLTAGGATALTTGCGNVNGAAAKPEADDPQLRVETVRVERRDVEKTVEIPGTVEGMETADLYAKVAGYLETISVDIGDPIEQGQVLAELSIPEMQKELQQREAMLAQAVADAEQADAAIRQAEAEVTSAEAMLAEAKTERSRRESERQYREVEQQRYQELVRSQSARPDLLDQARFQYQAAQSGLETAEARIQTATAAVASSQASVAKARADHRSAQARVNVAQAELEQTETMIAYGQPLPDPAPAPADRYPIDLAAALQLGGANHLQIAVAAEQVRKAASRLDRAEVMWVPTLNFGAGYTRHDGQIQATEGEVVEVSRSAGFVGGGPNIGAAPLTGLAGGPARMFVGLNPAEAYFRPLAERRAVQAASAERAVTFNDALLEVGLACYDLIAAQIRSAIATETLQNAQKLVQLTESFEEAGAGLAADTARARAQLASARMEQLDAEQALRVSSAELTRLLRLEAGVVLYPAETVPIPVTLVPEETPVTELIAQGLGNRPELSRHQALVAEAQERLRLEQWRPLVPNIQLGNSFGGFGGGPNSFFGDFEARNDFDALAVWEVENFGLGNGARRRERASQQRREWLQLQAAIDRVAAEVTQAHARAEIAAQQIEVAETLVTEASNALPLNFRAIRGGQLSPIEAQQAIMQLADARQQYLTAVIDYDRAQLQLLNLSPNHSTANCLGGSG